MKRVAFLLLIIFIFTFSVNHFVQAQTLTVEEENPCSYNIDENEDLVWTCHCQGSNLVEDCKVGWLISDPVCACCGDCVLNDFLLMGINIAEKILQLLGVFALLFFVIGGIIWIASGGSAEKVKKGKDMIKGAIIGIIIVLFAFTGIRMVMEAFQVNEEYLDKLDSSVSIVKCNIDRTGDGFCMEVGIKYANYVSTSTCPDGYICKFGRCSGKTTICVKRK